MIAMATTVTAITITTTSMAEPAAAPAALYRLLAWMSPAYPVGAFSYSHGLEWAVETGDITSLPTLVDWLTVVLRQGSGLAD
ncbi:MAG: urease accessory protein UreF, partial [Ferrovibrio sp.]